MGRGVRAHGTRRRRRSLRAGGRRQRGRACRRRCRPPAASAARARVPAMPASSTTSTVPACNGRSFELDEQGADARARDARTGLKLAGSAAGDGGAADGDARGSPGVGARPQREGLAGARDTDDYDDPVSFAGQSANGGALFVGERRSSEAGEAKRLRVGDAPTGAAPPMCQCDEAALGRQQLRRRPAALVTARQGDDAIAVEESRSQRFDALDVDARDPRVARKRSPRPHLVPRTTSAEPSARPGLPGGRRSPLLPFSSGPENGRGRRPS